MVVIGEELGSELGLVDGVELGVALGSKSVIPVGDSLGELLGCPSTQIGIQDI